MTRHWYHVPEAWLVVALLLASVAGSAWLIVAAVSHPDRATIEHARSSMPPEQAAPEGTR